MVNIFQSAIAAANMGVKKDILLASILERIKKDIKKWWAEAKVAEEKNLTVLTEAISEIEQRATLGLIPSPDKKRR